MSYGCYRRVALLAAMLLITLPAHAQVRDASAPDGAADDLAGRGAAELVQLGRDALNRADDAREAQRDAEQRAALEEVQRIVQALAAREPESIWIDFFQGRLFAFAGQSSDAIVHLQRFSRTGTGATEWTVYLVLGDLFLGPEQGGGFAQLAESNYRKADELNPNNPRVLYGRARAQAALGKLDDAIRFARRAVETSGVPSRLRLTYLASLLRQKGEFAEAEKTAREALTLAQDRLRTEGASRAALVGLENAFNTLIQILNDRARQEPSNALIYDQLIGLVLGRGQVYSLLALHDALAVADAGIAAAPPGASAPLHAARGSLLEQLGQMTEALAAYEKALAVDAHHPAAREGLNRIDGASRPPATPPPPALQP